MPKTNQPTWVSKTGQHKILLSDAAMQQLKNNPVIAKRFYDLTRNCQDPREFVFQVNQFIYDLRQRGFSVIDQKFSQPQPNQPNQADLSTIQNMQAELNNPNSLASMFAVEAAAAVVNAVQTEMAAEQQAAIQNTGDEQSTIQNTNDEQSANITSTVLSDAEKITAMATVIAVFEKKAPEEIFNGFEKKEEAGVVAGAFEKITGKKGIVEDFLKKEIGVSEAAATKPMPPIRKILEDEDKK